MHYSSYHPYSLSPVRSVVQGARKSTFEWHLPPPPSLFLLPLSLSLPVSLGRLLTERLKAFRCFLSRSRDQAIAGRTRAGRGGETDLCFRSPIQHSSKRKDRTDSQ